MKHGISPTLGALVVVILARAGTDAFGTVPACNCAKPSVCNSNGVVTAYAGAFGDIPGSTTLVGALTYLASYSGSSTTGAGSVQLTVEGGNTTIDVTVTGLAADETYPAHLHVEPCADDAGGHYKNDPSGPVDAVNEAWPGPSTDANGAGTGHSENGWAVDLSVPRSIVVHDLASLGKPKMLCADLIPPTGTTSLTTTREATSITTTVAGLRAGVTYPSHLHVEPCAVGAGGHYMNDTNGIHVFKDTKRNPRTR